MTKHQERMERARQVLPPAPKKRSHAARMAAATGVRLHGGTLRMNGTDRRRIVRKRTEDA